ncbi:Hypothetical_protein [Hexamita inflata]|uniref:Hypothetical_protein n=1 Tax=Hexamita inflata TaxID=28002 RepID=A0AA86TLM9_9EUKA|nr:Hypothetical protein HINF_LOCUS8730 [Hexamita inflata]
MLQHMQNLNMMRQQKRKEQKAKLEFQILKTQLSASQTRANKIQQQLINPAQFQQLIYKQEDEHKIKDQFILKCKKELSELHDLVSKFFIDEIQFKEDLINQYKEEAEYIQKLYQNNYNISKSPQYTQTMPMQQKDVVQYTEDEKIVGVMRYIIEGTQQRIKGQQISSMSLSF